MGDAISVTARYEQHVVYYGSDAKLACHVAASRRLVFLPNVMPQCLRLFGFVRYDMEVQNGPDTL